jgi:hypothetical protein
MGREIDDKTAIALISSIIANQIALDFNEKIIHTSVYKHDLKRKLKEVNQTLIKAEMQDFDFLEKAATGRYAGDLHEIQGTMIDIIAELGLYNFAYIIQVLQAFKKNKTVVMWLADKLNDETVNENEVFKLSFEKEKKNK